MEIEHDTITVRTVPDLYPLDKVGNCTKNGVMIEVSNSPDFSHYTTGELVHIFEDGYKYLIIINDRTYIYKYARHPQPKALTDEEIVGEGYVRLKVGDIKPEGYEFISKQNLGKRWFDSSLTEVGNIIKDFEFDQFYYRAPKPHSLTDTERHEILLKNVSADKCWVKTVNRIDNSWTTVYIIDQWEIRLPDSTEYVEITDEVLRGLK